MRDEFITGLLELAGGEGFTVLLSSHDIEEVDRLADHVVLLNHGRYCSTKMCRAARAAPQGGTTTLTGLRPAAEFPLTLDRPICAGRVLRFTDTKHDPQAFGEMIARLFPGCGEAGASRVTLRELFVTLVRSGQADAGI